MRSEDIPYPAYRERGFPAPTLVRAFGPWQVLASALGGRFYLLVVNPHSQEAVAVSEYETWAERQQDIRMLRRHHLGGDLGPPMPSRRKPPPEPPAFPAANALPGDGF